MKLMMIECVSCKAYFGTKAETGDHRCPNCNTPNVRYMFDESITNKELEDAQKLFKEIRELLNDFNRHDVSDIKILDLLFKK